MKKIPKIPKLPHGEGTMAWVEKRQQAAYGKMIDGKRMFVYADTPKLAMDKMREKGNRIRHHFIRGCGHGMAQDFQKSRTVHKGFLI